MEKPIQGYQADSNLKTDPPQGAGGTFTVRQKNPRKESILKDMYKVLVEQRKANEAIFEAKKKRVVIEHSANTKRAHYKVQVTKVRGEDGRAVYGSDPKIEAKVEECLAGDEDYQTCLQIIQKIDEEIFTAKLDLAYLDGEWKILEMEGKLMAVEK